MVPSFLFVPYFLIVLLFIFLFLILELHLLKTLDSLVSLIIFHLGQPANIAIVCQVSASSDIDPEILSNLLYTLSSGIFTVADITFAKASYAGLSMLNPLSNISSLRFLLSN